MAKAAKRKNDNENLPLPKPKKLKVVKDHKSIHLTGSEVSSSDSEEDFGYLESQNFSAEVKTLAKQKALKKNDSYTALFEIAVEERNYALIEILNGKASAMAFQHDKTQDSFKSMIITSLLHPTMNSSQHADGQAASKLKWTPHPIHQETSALLDVSRDLISTYERVSDEIAAAVTFLQLGQEWENDCQKMHALLDVGRKATFNQVRHLVLEPEALVSSVVSNDLSPVHNGIEAWNTFGKLHAQKDGRAAGESWAYVARESVKGIQRATKHLPIE